MQETRPHKISTFTKGREWTSKQQMVETHNWLILNIAGTISILESIKTFLSIDVSRTYTSWKKERHL